MMWCYSGIALLLATLVGGSPTQQRRFFPEVSLGIRQLDSQEGKLVGVVEPKVTWRTQGKLDEYDVEGGWEVLAQDRPPTLWPFSVWAKVQRAFRAKDKDYQVGARLQAHALSDQVDLQVTARLSNDTWVEVQASSSQDGANPPSLSTSVFHRQDLKRWGHPGTLWVHPRLQFASQHQHAKVQIGYELPDPVNTTNADAATTAKSTTFQVDAWGGGGGSSRPGLKCTASRFLDPANLIKLSPFVSTQGLLGVHVQRDFPDSGTLQVTLQPTESVDVTWQEGTWTARLEAPLFAKGHGIRVGLHRTLDLLV